MLHGSTGQGDGAHGMDAEKNLQEGRLDLALKEVIEHVRDHPSDAKRRIFLFQLLAVDGQWDRALNQLNVIGELEAGALAMVQAYREALRCEVFRKEVFAGERSPLVFGRPPQWIALLLEALKLTAQEKHTDAQPLREEAFSMAPAVAGTVDGDPFAWLVDGDTRLGPVLEALVNGRYYWIPFHHIHDIYIDEPADLRDMVWMPAHFQWANGGEAVGMIPTRYPNSENSDDNAIQLARRTEWHACAGEAYLGLGQRMLVTDVSEYPLMDIRHISFDTANTEGAETAIEELESSGG